MTRIHQRTDLACEQLDVALGIFLGGESYVSALTLAGAAEEILGKALEHQHKANVCDDWYDVEKQVHLLLHGRAYKKEEFWTEINNARNSAKHMRDTTQTTLKAHLENEALWMLVRACDNHRRLGFPDTDRMREFDEWFYENVVGEPGSLQ